MLCVWEVVIYLDVEITLFTTGKTSLNVFITSTPPTLFILHHQSCIIQIRKSFLLPPAALPLNHYSSSRQTENDFIFQVKTLKVVINFSAISSFVSFNWHRISSIFDSNKDIFILSSWFKPKKCYWIISVLVLNFFWNTLCHISTAVLHINMWTMVLWPSLVTIRFWDFTYFFVDSLALTSYVTI